MNIRFLIFLIFFQQSCGPLLEGENLDLDILFDNCPNNSTGEAKDDKIFIIGGEAQIGASNVYSHVSYSSDGQNWSMYENALPVRSTQGSAAVWNGKIWFAGGQSVSADISSALSGVYSSSNGKDWILESNLPKASADGSLFVYKNKLWHVGGRGVEDVASGYIMNTEDGKTWTTVTTAGFSGAEKRMGGVAFLFNGRLYYYGGEDDNPQANSDKIFYSDDGITWTQSSSVLPGAGVSFAASVFNGAMYFFGSTTITKGTSGETIALLSATTLLDLFSGIAISLNGKYFLLGGMDVNTFAGTNNVQYSSDGLNWSLYSQALPYNVGNNPLSGVRFSEKCGTGTNGRY